MEFDELKEKLLMQTIRLDGGEYIVGNNLLTISTDDGDCCGWADGNINLFEEGLITDVKAKENDDNDYKEELEITIFHENKELAKINMEAGSGSGWGYGSISTLYLGGDKLAEVSW